MFLGFLDEADHTTNNNFTVCGLTIIPLSNAEKISHEIDKLRSSCEAFGPEDTLKFSTSSKPMGCSDAQYRNLKNETIKIAARNGASFLGYCRFNVKYPKPDPDRNRLFGFNTLLGKYQDFLIENSSFGLVQVDRLDFSKNTKNTYRDGFYYLREKFQKGNEYPKEGKHKKLSNIISYSMSTEGTSHLSSINDILTGGLRYIANGDNPIARSSIQEQLETLMWRSKNNRFHEHGFTLRPQDRSGLPPTVVAEYDALRNFLNANYSSRE